MPDFGTLLLPDGRELACPRWAPAPDVMAERERVLRSTFFLVRIAGNDGVGEVWRCKRCKGRHPYLTASCIERPFSGLEQCLYAIYQQAGDLAAVKTLDPRQASAHNAARAIAREVMELPDLATMHPELARRQAQQAGLSRFDIQVGGVWLGRAEEIPKTLAQRLLDRVNQSRATVAKLQIEGLVAN